MRHGQMLQFQSIEKTCLYKISVNANSQSTEIAIPITGKNVMITHIRKLTSEIVCLSTYGKSLN